MTKLFCGRIGAALGGLIGGAALIALPWVLHLGIGFSAALTLIGGIAAGFFAFALIVIGVQSVFKCT